MKKLYVINLDKSRIIILMGLVTGIFGLAFLLGSRFSTSASVDENRLFQQEPDEERTNSFFAEAQSREPHELIEPKPQGQEGTESLPQEDEKLFEKNRIPVSEDPFLTTETRERPQVVTSSAPVDKLPVAPEGVTNSKPAPVVKVAPGVKPVEEGKFYSVQLGAYVHEKDANAYRKKLQQEGLKEARVDRGVRFYYVRAGKTHSKDEIENLYKKIHDTMKLEAIVVLR